MKGMKKEESLQIAVCNYLRLQYPDLIWTSESSGIKLTIGQAVKAKKMRSGDKLPDLWILEPRGSYHGLLIELKAEYPFKKDGTPKTEHIAKQIETLKRLEDKGYYTDLCCDFDQAKDSIDNYIYQTGSIASLLDNSNSGTIEAGPAFTTKITP